MRTTRPRTAAVLCGVALVALGIAVAKRRSESRLMAPVVPARVDATYVQTIQPIFDRRCVVCHSCFDSPCQLNLQSFEGLDRGANPKAVYQPDRLTPAHPTRMFQDAKTTAEWRGAFGFFPVVAREEPTVGDRAGSLLWRAIEQRRSFRGGGPFSVDETVCPGSAGDLESLFRAQPEKGMPYGFPPLDDAEANAIAAWIGAGAGGLPSEKDEASPVRSERDRWEAFLNAPDPKSRLVARYLFEHLFFAHLTFASASGGASAPLEWFRLVRSRSAAPLPVDEIATVRPFDDPGAVFHYRFRRLTETIVEKTHVPYALSDAKLAHLRHLFFDADWGAASLDFPSYAPDVAANPFVAFQSIPARARYQFLLDDAHYHVKTFIHGPVCRGGVALDVIDEHFLIFFLAPDADLTVTHPELLPRVAADLAVPAQGGEGIEAVHARWKLRELAWLKERAAFARDTNASGHTMADVWNGDGVNPDAVLTVYRHFDSSFVMRGAVGGVPKTAWVLDYPIFERMYYDLVAGFDVFGDLVHQVSTRRYMNLLRIEAESSFLSFLPESRRAGIRASWYRPAGASRIVDTLEPVYAAPETRVTFADSARSKEELITRLVTGGLPAAVVGVREPVQWTDVVIDEADPRARLERAARGFAAAAGPFVGSFPDATLLRLRTGGDDPVFTIVRNKAHLNIDFMFLEDEERVASEDTLHLVPGVVVSRPNLFLTVNAADVERFVADLRGLTGQATSWSHFLDTYGARRNDASFWATSDFFNARFSKLEPVTAGILDLSRYSND